MNILKCSVKRSCPTLPIALRVLCHAPCMSRVLSPVTLFLAPSYASLYLTSTPFACCTSYEVLNIYRLFNQYWPYMKRLALLQCSPVLHSHHPIQVERGLVRCMHDRANGVTTFQRKLLAEQHRLPKAFSMPPTVIHVWRWVCQWSC